MTFTSFSTPEMAQMEADVLASLTGVCTIQRKGGAEDGTGGPSAAGAAYATVYSNVACRLKYRRRIPEVDLTAVAGQLSEISLMTLKVPMATDLQKNDQVLVAGVAYLVLGTDVARTTRVCLTALVREVGA
jgi:hypothetical protein